MRLRTQIVNLAWYRVVLNSHALNASAEAHIRDVFDRAFSNRNEPPGMTLWLERNSDGRTIYYLSPISVTTEPGLVHQLCAVRSIEPPCSARLVAGKAR